MIVTIDGKVVQLRPEVAVMIIALIDHQEQICKQGGGEVALDYLGCDVTFTLSRRNYRAKARRLIDNSIKSAS